MHLNPHLRLKTLNLSNNKISRLTDVSDSLPFLENLCLMNNKISDVNEIFTLRNCTKIKRLILFGNVVTQVPTNQIILKGSKLSLVSNRCPTIIEDAWFLQSYPSRESYSYWEIQAHWSSWFDRTSRAPEWWPAQGSTQSISFLTLNSN